MLTWFLPLAFNKFDCIFIAGSLVPEIQQTKLLPGALKTSHILRYEYKNLRLKAGFYLLGRGGEASPKKVSPEKKLKAISNTDLT